LPNPEDSDKDNEFIEIYNMGETKVNLGGWVLKDKMGRVKTFEINENVEIKAGGYKTFYSDETGIALNNSGDGIVLRDNKGNITDETPVSGSAKEDQAYALDKDDNWVWTLRPTAGRKNIIREEKKINDIKQDDSSRETGVNDDDGSSQGAGANDEQDERISKNSPSPFLKRGDSQEDNNNNDVDDGNSDAENAEYNFSDEIVISEIYPNPRGRDNKDGNYEWIEIYNCSSENVNLIGWQIDDILKKGSKPYLIKENKIISAESHLVFTNEETKVIFNNSGDEINLLWPDGTIVDSTQYEKSIEEQSYNWADGDWSWSQAVTPNRNNAVVASVAGIILGAESVANLNEEETETDESDIDAEENIADNIKYIEATVSEAKKLPRFSYVKISGVVSTPPGIFSDNIFYLAGSGIQVYGKNLDISGINIGDEIEISGQISEIGEEKRIILNKAKNVKIISRDNLVKAKIVSTVDIGEEIEGCLVMIEGGVVEIKDDVFFLDDGSGKVKVYIKPQTGIKRPEIEINDWMVVTGQASRTSVGYRILPRFQTDLKLGKVSGTSTASAASVLANQEKNFIGDKKEKNMNFILENMNSIVYAIIILVGALILIDWGKMKIAKSRKSIKSLESK